ncbi:hypothetical protein IAD21_01536 [Abditibacteriota bacterium]|nr:hypothetical protein IAD21_01536 [Abditibacteriota bacterium]
MSEPLSKTERILSPLQVRVLRRSWLKAVRSYLYCLASQSLTDFPIHFSGI